MGWSLLDGCVEKVVVESGIFDMGVFEMGGDCYGIYVGVFKTLRVKRHKKNKNHTVEAKKRHQGKSNEVMDDDWRNTNFGN